MKCVMVAVLLAIAHASNLHGRSGFAPAVKKVVELVTVLRDKGIENFKAERILYDKHACWCEDEKAAKKTAIDVATKLIASTDLSRLKLRAVVASQSVDIKQAQKDIAETQASMKEAEATRIKGHTAYEAERVTFEESIAALFSSIKQFELVQTSTKKGKFLASLQESKLVSTFGPIRAAVNMPVVSKQLSAANLDLVRDFLETPEKFIQQRKPNTMAAMQVGGQTPGGDYNPAGDQIHGILKAMYDDMAKQNEKDAGIESASASAHQNLMATKSAELTTRQGQLLRQNGELADKKAELASLRSLLKDTKEQLEADEAFLAQTSQQCNAKSIEWSNRARLRTEETHGMNAAIEILTNDEAKSTFDKATKKAKDVRKDNDAAASAAAAPAAEAEAPVAEAPALPMIEDDGPAHAPIAEAPARDGGGLSFLQLGAEAKAGGHFDKLITMVEGMIRKLHEEKKADLDLYNSCNAKQLKIRIEVEDLGAAIRNLKDVIARKTGAKKELEDKIELLVKDIADSTKSIATMISEREADNAAFEQATKDDVTAVTLIKGATASLNKFYTDNDIEMKLLEQAKPKKPETWHAEYAGEKTQTTSSVVAILDMILEDLENEIKDEKHDEATAYKSYTEDMKGMKSILKHQKTTKAEFDGQLSSLSIHLIDKTNIMKAAETDKVGQLALAKSFDKECNVFVAGFEDSQKVHQTNIDSFTASRGTLASLNAGGMKMPR